MLREIKIQYMLAHRVSPGGSLEAETVLSYSDPGHKTESRPFETLPVFYHLPDSSELIWEKIIWEKLLALAPDFV